MNFEALLAHLPDCPGPAALPIGDGPGNFRYIEQGLPEFIGPDLLPSIRIEQPAQPRILIVSAAGAVGKSTLARELARRKHARLWALAQAAAVAGHPMTGPL